MTKKLLLILSVCLCWGLNAQAQKNALVFGVVRDSLNRPIADVNIAAIGASQQTISDEKGYFQLSVPAQTSLVLGFSYIGRPNKKIEVRALQPGERFELNPRMEYGVGLNEVVVTEERDRDKV